LERQWPYMNDRKRGNKLEGFPKKSDKDSPVENVDKKMLKGPVGQSPGGPPEPETDVESNWRKGAILRNNDPKGPQNVRKECREQKPRNWGGLAQA